MASIASLGVHQPTGLRHAIEEGILDADPPPSAYTWDISLSKDGDNEQEDELLTTKDCVLWSRGGVFRKSFKFDLENEPIAQALLANFPASAEHQSSDKNKTKSPGKPTLSKALVVFLKTQAHIYFLSGASHVVHMPFEVESACPAPCGVIIQRKPRANNTAPVSLRLPKVPPNSFVSSQPPPSSAHTQRGPEFSTEGLGNPKVLPLRLSSTLENMWQPPMETSESHWPRLVCLTDPLLEIGLVVTQQDRTKPLRGRRNSTGPLFLNPAEEMLHIESIKLPNLRPSEAGGLHIAVTVNREAGMYTVWRLTYLENEDPFLSKKKKRRTSSSRRRSSMAPGLPSGAATPIHPSMRESFGAPLPGKRTRKSVRIEENEKALDNALNSLDPDKGNDATRRQSRRVSSLLARADLSASQDRATFTEQSMYPNHASRRLDSQGSQRARMSSGYAGSGFGGSFSANRDLNSLHEAPVDNLLEELRAGGDFEGFHSMGLEDHDFDGLTREILLTKIHSFSMDNSNLRYSLSGKPARTHSKVFILASPPTATDEQGRAMLLIGIQDPVDRRLQLLTLHIDIREEKTTTKSAMKGSLSSSRLSIVPGEPRRVQSVVDSCKLSDWHETIMILSEDTSGGRELSLQSPWGKVTTVTLPLLFSDNLHSLNYAGSHKVNKEVRGRRSMGIGMTCTQIDLVCHSNSCGVVDLKDKDGRFHRVKVQLQPSSIHIRRILDVCRSVLPTSYADKLLAGWWHIMQWLQSGRVRGLSHPIVDKEWTALVILLFSSFLVLRHNSEASLQGYGDGAAQPPCQKSWDTMRVYENPSSSACPPWSRNKGWQWLLDTPAFKAPPVTAEIGPRPPSFLALHIELAQRWMASSGGVLAFGFDGYLPTALGRGSPGRSNAAWSMMVALHLLLEEQKLNILTPEDTTHGQGDLRTVLCQISRWLGWQKHEAIYALGMDVDLESVHDLVPSLASEVAEPPACFCVLTWLQDHLAYGKGSEYPTLALVYSAGSQDAVSGKLRTQLWESLTPRSLMFSKFFGLLGLTTNRYDMVVAMYESGFTSQILETLPEAVLTPLQDIIFICQPNPPPSWSKELLSLVGRTDISTVLRSAKTWRPLGAEINAPSHAAKWDVRMLCQHLDDFHDRLEETEATERQAVVRSLFREDRRLNEAQNLLSTSKHRVIRLVPKPDTTEAEYLEQQKELVATVAISTLAIPAGRGLLYFALRFPLLTQKYQINGFQLTCVVKPVNNSVGVDKTMFTEDKINWAFFHQGVSGGLAISPHAKGIDTSWILYNKPGSDLNNRHAGFLLALGLNGHLKSVAKWVAFKYLTPKHTMTSIGLLLGLAASYLGTMDSLITRLLSVHVTRMLPRGAAELNLSQHTQTTGIMGIGLLYCNSQHRRMSEIMMSEIEYLEDGEEENPLRDEGYRLAAGFALGFINLGKGGDLKGLRDMRLTEKLLTIATSTKRVELAHVLDRAAAGAVMAIALIFMKSEDHIVARKIDVPDTTIQFDYVRPDILLLRTVAKNIILWKEVTPTFDWIRNSLPSLYHSRARLSGTQKLQSKDMPFFSILAGICFSLGLRFAGSANIQVRDLLVHHLDEFIRIVRSPVTNFDAELARSNARMCMGLVALSCAIVMAGTGDIAVLRRLRSLHGRDDKSTTYGSHMAAHLAIGALFLGCGTATFGTSNLATAALLVAFYPLFPANVQDNRSHLQAFRHFWVLATEPRCLVTKDLATGQPINTPINIHLKPGSATAIAAAAQTGSNASDPEVITLRRQTPCLLPPLDDVLRVATDANGLGYWDLVIDLQNHPSLTEEFRKNQSVYLRRRPAHEGTFPATLRALGSGEIIDAAVGRGPMEWVFDLQALQDLTHAERALVLDRLGSGGGVGEGEAASTAVDAKLVLRSGLDTEGWSRDRLLGLRLLFEWAERRGVFVGSIVDKNKETQSQVEDGKGKKKGKTPAKKGKKKVSMSVGQQGQGGERSEAMMGRERELDVAERGYVWWMRESAIKELKGRAWLAGRET
ncbi:hypothetical protein QBC36DRAFT_323634 [Triangularia setosa]|uniref:Anaphase-promoting complex subunit 1 N-terminal domain-containing protein n=1 Tax=Triangularia setosa TaxID=2587417 RepID=A0AAN6WBH2_9PEZI|nr:hypothetical protein QBC36DRAFT_323634 [Podospora setosa]